MKRRLIAGEIPWEWANSVLPIWGREGEVFVVFDTKPEVRSYAADGTLRWSVLLDDAVFEAALAACIRKNAEEPNTNAIAKLRYIVDGELAGDDLWLSLNTEDGSDGAMLVLSGKDGRLRRRISLAHAPGGQAFALSADHTRVYLADPFDAHVLALTLR